MNKPLIEACRIGNLEKVKKLLNRHFLRPDVNCRTERGSSPLSFAAYNGYKEIVNTLIDYGAEVNILDHDGESPLHCASGKGHIEIVEMLIIKGAEVNIKADFGYTPLYSAANGGHKEIAELLINHGADVDVLTQDGRSSLYEASISGYKDVAELLVNRGAAVNIPNDDGETPLYWASSHGHTEIVSVLVNNGADTNFKDTKGRFPLLEASLFNHKEIVELLVTNGADVNNQDNSGCSPLHAALGNNELITFLINNGVNINIRDKDSKTPLDWALEYNYIEAANILTKFGAKKGEEVEKESLHNLADGRNGIIDNGNGTLTDHDSGLMWQMVDDGIRRTQEEAFTYCSSLSFGGFHDWRLPQLSEFNSLKKSAESCDFEVHSIYSPNNNVFWTATNPPPSLPSNVAYASDGTTFYRTNKYYVRAVRGEMV